MRLRSPSAGFLYLLLTAAGAVTFFNYLTSPFFFEHKPRSEAADVGEARYLLKLAHQHEGTRGYQFLTTARNLAERHQNEDLLSEIDSLMEERKTQDRPTGFVEVQPGISISGFDKLGQTMGTKTGTIRLENPTSVPFRVQLKFDMSGQGSGKYVIAGKATNFEFVNEAGTRQGSFATPPIDPLQTVDVVVSCQRPNNNAQQRPGLRFIGAEIRL